ncbi:hypothetical protein, partial [Kitasatospora albolonga]|uniref:hypothetical protein n=1 Tax=Kitasatospora albolonga TaxID=68173 RepID=UPI0031E86C5E
MAVVEQGDQPLEVDLGQDAGDETLPVGPALQRRLDAPADVTEVGEARSRLPERGQHHAAPADGLQS